MRALLALLRDRFSRRPAPGGFDRRLDRVRGLHDAGRIDEAWTAARALAADAPLEPQAWQTLGHVAHRRGDYASAFEAFRRSLALDPDNAVFHNNLGALHNEVGDAAEARRCFLRAVELDPDLPGVRANLIFTGLMLAGESPADILAEHLAWARVHAEHLHPTGLVHANHPDPDRPLRIGYVSGDFRGHALTLFVEPILRHHDRDRYRVHCYHSGAVEDEVTARLRGLVAVFRDIRALPDNAAAAQIRADGIDILVDLSGHLRDNRLLVFARKAAPVQVTYLAYPASTGLSAVDYRLTDVLCDPPGHERYYREQLIRLPDCTWCYQAPVEMPPVAPPPWRSRGAITFGSTNNCVKISAPTLDLWARVLAHAPGSRMLVATVPEAGRPRLLRALAERGVAPERIEFAGRLPRARFWDLYAQIDILLDTFPCNGGTTTCEALWQGVPVVSLCGEAFQSRAGLSVLSAVGLAEWVARTPQEYVEIALKAAADPERLGALRGQLRTRMASSPLCDAPAFVRGLEAAYREMWRAWCDRAAVARPGDGATDEARASRGPC